MTRDEFNIRYTLSVEKAALGVAIISRLGPKMGFDDDTIDDNRTRLVEMLADGIGLSFETVATDVLKTERKIPDSLWKNPQMSGIMNSMVGNLKVSGLLSAT